MQGFKNVIVTEPALIVGLVQSAIGLGTAFGLGWTGEQVAVVLAFTGTLLSVIARSMVTPMATVDQTVKDRVSVQMAEARPLREISAEEFLTVVDLRNERDRLLAKLEEKEAREAQEANT